MSPAEKEKPVMWFNPKCSTCRNGLELVKSKGIEPTLRLYLEQPPTKAELASLFAKLAKADVPALQAVRRKEPEFAAEGLSDASSTDELIAAIVKHPRLLERPILEWKGRAVVGRPIERLIEKK